MIYPHSQIWTPQTISDIHARTDVGGYSLTGYRTFRALPSFDELVFLAAGLTRFPLEGYKEKCRTETTLGPRCTKPLVLEVPIYVASSNDLPKAVRAALAIGSALGNTALSIGGGGGGGAVLLPEERKVGARLIYEIRSDTKSPRPPASVEAGGVQVDVVNQMSSESVQTLIRDLRGEQEHHLPIFLRMGAGRVKDEVRLAVKAGADGIVLLGLETPPLSDPAGLLQYCRLPMMAALSQAREALQENKVLGDVSLIAGNGVVTGADAAKALALGADAVAIQQSALTALGSSISPPMAAAAATKKKKSKSKKIKEDRRRPEPRLERGGEERVAKYINSMIMEVALLARSLGKGDVHSLEFEDLAALTIEASLISGVRLAGE